MIKLSLISHYYNHADEVVRQVNRLKSLDQNILDQIEFVLVDDCSEDIVILEPGNLDLKHFRVITSIDWNQGGSRNLGAFNARGEWALFFDIDQLFRAGALEHIIELLPHLNTNYMYYFKILELINILNNESLSCHPNTFLVNLPEFKKRAMYDEDFCGFYGYEDIYMGKVWDAKGGIRRMLDDIVYFEQLPFGTTTLDRDTSRNLALAQLKMAQGTKTAPSILRFEWEEISYK